MLSVKTTHTFFTKKTYSQNISWTIFSPESHEESYFWRWRLEVITIKEICIHSRRVAVPDLLSGKKIRAQTVWENHRWIRQRCHKQIRHVFLQKRWWHWYLMLRLCQAIPRQLFFISFLFFIGLVAFKIHPFVGEIYSSCLRMPRRKASRNLREK